MATIWPKTPPAWLVPWLIWRFKHKVGPRPSGAPAIIPAWAICVLGWCSWRRANKVGIRPVCAPLPIPMWSYDVLKQVNKAVPVGPSLSSFFTTHSGTELLSPGGQTEQGPAMYAAGMRWAWLNVSDGTTWDGWVKTRESLASAGIVIAVGGRVANCSVEFLMNIAMEQNVPCILNIEDEFKTTPPSAYEAQIQSMLALDPLYKQEVILNTVGWLYNDPDFTAIAHRPVQLQIYPEDMRFDPSELPQKTADCIAHAQAKGFTEISPMFQAYHEAEPSWYDFWGIKARSWFAGDYIGAGLAGGWTAWAI